MQRRRTIERKDFDENEGRPTFLARSKGVKTGLWTNFYSYFFLSDRIENAVFEIQ